MTRTQMTGYILAECREWLGTPYQHQGSLKHVGCDCLGLLRGVWRHLYGREPQALPHYTSDWGEADGSEPLLNALNQHMQPEEDFEAGSILLFRWRPTLPAKHLGIITGPNTFIHSYDRVGVIESTLGHHWRNKVAGIFAFPSPESSKAQ